MSEEFAYNAGKEDGQNGRRYHMSSHGPSADLYMAGYYAGQEALLIAVRTLRQNLGEERFQLWLETGKIR